jgi:hypothetical protein
METTQKNEICNLHEIKSIWEPNKQGKNPNKIKIHQPIKLRNKDQQVLGHNQMSK